MEVKIEKLIYGGEGLGHAEGSTVFVPFVLPDEVVFIEPVERKRKFLRGRVHKLLTVSPVRTEPPCPYFLTCGGCHYQHIPYEIQLRYKTEILRETLRRIGRIEWDGPITSHASPPWGYRNRAQWKIRPAGRAAGNRPEEKSEIGYLRAGSTALCSVEECQILSPLLEKTLKRLAEAFAAGALPRAVREIEAFANAKDHKLLLTVSVSSLPHPAEPLVDQFRAFVPGLESILLHDPGRDRMELAGPGFLDYEAAGRNYRVGHLSFFQVNRFLIEEMIRAATDAGDSGGLALDLFAGVGLFTLPLAARFQRVVAVEVNPASLRDLEANSAASTPTIDRRCATVEDFLQKFHETPQFVVIDPPRAGLTPKALARLVQLAPDRFTYVSCEPSTLARDLAALVAGGYTLEEVHLFDLFPQTFHIESLIRLARRR